MYTCNPSYLWGIDMKIAVSASPDRKSTKSYLKPQAGCGGSSLQSQLCGKQRWEDLSLRLVWSQANAWNLIWKITKVKRAGVCYRWESACIASLRPWVQTLSIAKNLFYFFVALQMEHQAMYMMGKSSTIELHPHPNILFYFLFLVIQISTSCLLRGCSITQDTLQALSGPQSSYLPSQVAR
jgi:hypothetical protein